MAEESLDNKSISLASPSGAQSPRRIIGNGNGNNNDNNAGCIGTVAVATGPVGSTVATVVNESVTTTNTGVVVAGTPTTVAAAAAAAPAPAAAVATVPSSSLSPLQSTLTTTASTSGTTTTITGGATSGGGGGIAGMVVSPGIGVTGAKNSGSSSPRSPKHPRKLRVKLSEQQLESATREELAAKWREQDLYVECLEAQAAAQEGELACLRDSEEKYRQQCCEISHRERILARRLASKEQQLLGYVNQITEMRASQVPSSSALRSALLDPAVNILIQKLRQELLSTKAKLEDTQNELSAWKFTPDSNTGKRLMAKCRLLYQENEELGRMIASGRIAKLEGELVLQKSFSEEVKKSQSELDEFLQDLDEDVEGMQSTIYFLQQELRKARESVSLLQQENNAFKSVTTGPPPQPPPQPPPPQPPPPPLEINSGLSNGVTSGGRTDLMSKIEPTVVGDETAKDVDSIDRKAEASDSIGTAAAAATATDANVAGRIIPPLIQTSTVAPGPPAAKTLLADTNEAAAGSLSDERKFERCRPDDADDSSNDSAALIIKVENEELSDREDEDELEGVPTRATVVETCETRGPQRQSLRTRDKITMKNESAVVGKSNGDERNSSRSSSRRLLRDRTAKRDKSAADSDDEHRLHKKKRRESILSLDYNETDDDALLLTNGESIQSDTEDGP